MSITYLKFAPYFEKRFDHLLPEHSVLLFDPVIERGALQVGDRFRRVDPVLRAAEWIIFRGSTPDFADIVQSDPLLPPLTVGSFVSVLCPDPERLHPRIFVPSWSASGPPPIALEIIREIETLAILERGGAIFMGGDKYHFVVPSGCHAAEFIRVADALRDFTDVNRLADWVMPLVSLDTVILADTGSILALLLMIQGRIYERFSVKIPIECVDGYPVNVESLSELIEDVLARTPRSSRLLLLLSVNSTGKFVRIFRQMTGEEDQIVVLCDGTENPATERVTTFSRHLVQRWDVDETGDCAACETLVKIAIDATTYNRLPSAERKQEKITPTVAERAKPFWEAVDRSEALSIHATVGYDNMRLGQIGHMAYYIDITKLLTDAQFHSKCLQVLNSIPRPDCVLLPQHAGTAAIVALLTEAYSDLPIVQVPPGRFSGGVSDLLREMRRILVADDALIGGSTLRGFRSELHRVTQAHGVSPEIYAFVCLARPHTQQALKSVEQPYRASQGSNLHYGELVMLPLECPWCREMKALQRLIRNVADPKNRSLISERIRMLRETLEHPIWDFDHAVAPDKSVLTRGSFFGELRRITAFAAAASAAHTKREEIRNREYTALYDVIDASTAIQAYFESIFLAGILRTVPQQILRWPGQDEAVSKALAGIDPTLEYPGTIAEIGWAALAGKIPPTAALSLLQRAPVESQSVAAMEEMLASYM